jgi:GT2 family glycosyltransferase
MRQDSLWVGVLDVDTAEPVTAVSGPERAEQGRARVLVRIHGAPVGYVTVGLRPGSTLTARARAAAEVSLAEAIHRHVQLDGTAGADETGAEWLARVACPHRHSPQGPGISVIICTRNRPLRLRECLRSLQAASYAPLEILVVDNAPASALTERMVAEAAADDPRIRYLREPLPGLSNARNSGFARARYDLIAFTDDDTVVDPGWPAALAAGFAADPDAACITGLVCSRSLDTPPERYFDGRYPWGTKFEPRRYDLAENRDRSGIYPFSAGIFGTGANFAVRRPALRRMGGFDTLLGAGAPTRGGEDLDVFVRVILAGERICFVPSALVWHQHREDTRALAGQLYSYGYGLGAYLAKRLAEREMSVAVLCRALARSATVARQMGQASRAGRFVLGGLRLAAAEACGVLAGAACYYRLATRKQRS